MFSRAVTFFLIMFMAGSCKKDPVTIAVEPVISLLSVTPQNATQYSDPVIISISYEDGDGDLGENNDGIKNCFVTDNRIGLTSGYRIRQLAPSNTTIAISGTLDIELGGQALTDSVNSQSVSYTLYVVDRAGHRSNSITTPSIVLHR